ncbi:4334_t:CDS:2, partial [Acaulospora morrowiae]
LDNEAIQDVLYLVSDETFHFYDRQTWGRMSKHNLERDKMNDDNDWLNPGQRDDMLDQAYN